MFKIGDMIKVVAEPENTGFITDTETYHGACVIQFLSGQYAGRSFAINNREIISVDDVIEEVEEKEEVPVSPPVIKAAEKPVAPRASKKKWSKVQIVAMIKENPAAVERGILCLNKNSDRIPEKSRPYVAYWAGYIAKGKSLSGRHLFNARRTCYFNAKVLVDAANGVL